MGAPGLRRPRLLHRQRSSLTARPRSASGEHQASQEAQGRQACLSGKGRGRRVQGVVIIEATIDSLGNVANARVLKSVPTLDQAAIDAVQQWQFKPTLLNGVAVPVIMTVTVNFTLDSRLLAQGFGLEQALRA